MIGRDDSALRELLAVVVHAILAPLHFLALVFHVFTLRRMSWHILFHLFALIYDVAAVRRHGRRLL